jgi:hypothetical protein
MRISKYEKWAVVIISCLLWIILALLAGGPIFSDEMLYLDAGLRNMAVPSYGNRYFHIYLQKFFITIFPTPLAGVRVFWGLLIALTTGLIYLNARTFARKSTILHGLLAIAFFFSFPLIKGYSGEPAVDITAMTMNTVYLTIYIWAVKNPEVEKKALFILGVLAFLSLKTKETTIFINILLVGFIVKEKKGRSLLIKLKNIVQPFFFGVVTGIGIFILLDMVFLADPFFAIAPSTFKAVFSNYDFDPGFFFGPTNWYEVYFLDELLLPFLLFLISGIQLQKTVENKIRIIWIYPLIFAAFLSWNMLRVPWGFIPRFFFPALPVIAILAPQSLRFKWPRKKSGWMWFIISLLLSVGLAYFMRLFWLDTASNFSFDYARILDAVYFPILTSILLAAVIWINKTGWKRMIVQIFCIGSLLYTPLLYNFKYFATYPKVKEQYAIIFYPFEKFRNQLVIEDNDLLYISGDIKTSQDMLSRDPNDIIGMYNFFFDARIGKDNVFLGYNQEELGTILLNRDFSYVLLSENDIKQLKDNGLWETVKTEYRHVYRDENEIVYLLKY